MRIRPLLFAAAVLSSTAPAAARNVSVPLDEVRMIAFERPVATVYVGNPMIADITMIDTRHAFVLGKAFGATNIIALDRSGSPVGDENVTVFGGASGSTVTLHKGINRITYACAASRCEAAPVPGDGKDLFDNAIDQITKHQDLGAKAAAAR